MEFIFGLAIIIIILLLLGVPVATIAAGVWVALILISATSEVFFLLSLVLLLCTKKKPALFLRLEKGKRAGLFAIYQVDEKEVKNLFPTDEILRNVFYTKENVNVRILNIGKQSFSMDFVTTLVIGLGVPAFAFMTIAMLGFIG